MYFHARLVSAVGAAVDAKGSDVRNLEPTLRTVASLLCARKVQLYLKKKKKEKKSLTVTHRWNVAEDAGFESRERFIWL